MDQAPSLDEVLAELPQLTHAASQAVLEVYVAVRQARCMGATYDQLVASTGMSRGNVQRVVDGGLPKFAVLDA